ncbi:MAG: TAXI family TRAP transporter solute-binding subunit [Dehalobacterium sp.]
MRKNKRFLLIMLLISVLVLSACGQSKNTETNGSETDSKANDSPSGISVSAAPLGGTFNNYATGWANVIGEKMNIATNVEATAGPIINIELVDRGESDIGLVTMGPAYEAYNGIGWADKKYENIRSIFPMYTSYLHWIALPGSNIKSVMDLEGKVIGTGAKGGTPDYYTGLLVEDLGIKIGRIVNGSFSDYANQMADGQMDAFGTFSPTGHPTAVQVIKTMGANVIGVGEKSKEIAEKHGITSGIIKANSYEGQTEDIETITVWSAYIASKDLSEDFVYELVKTTFESKEELAKVIKEAKELSLDVIAESIGNIPLHPGAIKYYAEQGIELPDSAYPPEYQK